ncbi:hypothetical protein [Crenobacter intestini]|uniref:Uncharacterized protein n=1 Tax=Crenobacter intestini TaxID=2563443 RepID=A0A4T0UU44_9NEIS|nr:hypothetical protein [Crenobacter intestini]TIC82095.1 hypothetical protein E5K04_10075 [Crenobacter intestini]
MAHTETRSGIQRLFNLPEDAEGLPLAAVEDRASRRLSEFSAFALQTLSEMGITIPPAVSFVSCPNCQLEINSQHPHAAEIQAWLNESLEAQERFKKVEVLYELIRASELAGQTIPPSVCFHVGLTSAGAIAYFETFVPRCS